MAALVINFLDTLEELSHDRKGQKLIKSPFPLFFPDVVDSIKLNHVGVPNYANQDKEAVLGCPYDLEGASLYSVKWYKNGREFFRYICNKYTIMKQSLTLNQRE